MTDDRTSDEILADWNARLSASLGVPGADIATILELASLAAHAVIRPAAPLTTFLVGYAAGMQSRSGDVTTGALDRAVATVRDLASREDSRDEGP